MRDMETCREEIFRRSAERIRLRQRRRRMAATFCVPLVLCLAVVLTMGRNWRLGSPAPNSAETDVPPAPTAQQEAQVLVAPLNGGESWTMDSAAAEALETILGGWRKVEYGQEQKKNEAPDDAKDSQEASTANEDTLAGDPNAAQPSIALRPETNLAETVYRLTLRGTAADGDYLLTADGLTDEATGETIPLTGEEAEALFSVLSIGR